jgi:cytochrome P450
MTLAIDAGMPGQRPRGYRPPAPIPHTERLGAFALLRQLRDNPAAAWGVWHFEDRFVSARTVLGETIVINDPAAIRHVLVENVGNYPKDDLQRRVLKPGLGEGLLTAEGETWRRVRRTLAPLFTPRMVDGFADMMLERAEKAASRLAAVPVGGTVNVSAEMTRVTFDVLAGTLFSDGIVSGADRFAEAVTGYFDTVGRLDPLDALGLPDWIPRLSWFTGRKSISFFEAEVKRIIARRKGEITQGTAPADLLTALINAADPETGIGLTDEEVAANIITFITAGHETTANALGWALFLLAKHPDQRERAEREAVSAGDHPVPEWPDRLPFVRAVVEEAMRLYPPAATLTRKALTADSFGDIPIAKGALVVISPYVVHRHRMLWSNPDFFRPERFLPGAREAIDRFQYLPFGAGPRICIGQRFAMLEAVIILTSVLRAVRLDWPQRQAVNPVQRVTLRPVPELQMVRMSPVRSQ